MENDRQSDDARIMIQRQVASSQAYFLQLELEFQRKYSDVFKALAMLRSR